jgi:AcrR family transcriptional regulator
MQRGGEVQQLPRGRHRLSREQVTASQRGRMLAAMTDAVAEKGFARTTVKDVLERARVSRETFYEQFADKEECFLAAYEGIVGLLRDEVLAVAQAAGEQGAGPHERLDRAIGAYLGLMAQEPATARVFLVDVLGAGPEFVARRFAVHEAFVETVAQVMGGDGPGQRALCEAFTGAVGQMVTARIATGRAAELPGLRPHLAALARRLWPGEAG